MNKESNINEVIYLLEKLNPIKLEEIRRSNSNFNSLLSGGVTLGDSIANTDELKIKSDVCYQGNLEIIKKCDIELPKLKKRLKTSKRLKLFSQIVTTISSAAVVTTLLSENDKYKSLTLITGILSLLGAIFPIISEFMVSGISNKNLSETFNDLVKSKIEVENYNIELNLFTKNGFDREKISDTITKCNAKCAELNELLLLS